VNIANAKVSEEIRQCERQRRDAMLRGAVPELEKLLSDDLIYGHSSGEVDDKQSYLAKIASGSNVYEKLELDVATVIPMADAALATGFMIAMVRLPERLVAVDSRFMTVWSKGDGIWRLVGHQTAPRPNPG
jgi:hypothetical protein